jgi:hypothetical protein
VFLLDVALPRLSALLCEAERERVRRYVFEKDRRRFVVGRAVLETGEIGLSRGLLLRLDRNCLHAGIPRTDCFPQLLIQDLHASVQ